MSLRQPPWLLPLALCVALVVGLGLLLPPLALGQILPPDDGSGQALLQRCQSNASYDMYCMGKLNGLNDSHNMMVEIGANRLFCLPSGVTVGQVKLVVIRYLQTHPERLHWPWSGLATMALAQAFPCR
jgi:hypothetical protein